MHATTRAFLRAAEAAKNHPGPVAFPGVSVEHAVVMSAALRAWWAAGCPGNPEGEIEACDDGSRLLITILPGGKERPTGLPEWMVGCYVDPEGKELFGRFELTHGGPGVQGAERALQPSATTKPTEPTAPVKLFKHRRAADTLQAVLWDGSTEAWGAIVDMVDGTPYAVSRKGTFVFIGNLVVGPDEWVCRWPETTKIIPMLTEQLHAAYIPVTDFAPQGPASPGRAPRLPPAAK